MKKYIASILLALVVGVSCSNDGVNKTHRWIGDNDVSGFTVYRGSSDKGAIKVEMTDSAKQVAMDTVFRGKYNKQGYDSFSVLMEGERITYTNPQTHTQVVSTGKFRNDSLFIDLSDGSELYVAMGNMDSLYLQRAYCRYPIIVDGEKKDTIVELEEELNLEKVLHLAGYATATDLNLRTDTIRWCNVKFVFRK